VRVVAEEDLGWEENPPTLLEFMRRDLRWCQGNMQYFRFLSLGKLKPVSRYQLMLAIVMFIGSPAWIGLLVLATIALVSFDSPSRFIRADIGNILFVWVLVMWFSPKIATFIDLLLRPDARRAFGGAGLVIVNFIVETAYSVLLCPILWIGHTIFLGGLLFHREIGWIGQVRDDHAVSFRLALSSLWPQTLLGWTAIGLVSATQPAALPYVLFLAGGPAMAIPFAMLTAWAPLGRFAVRIGIGRLPEETTTPEELRLLSLPAIRTTVQPATTGSV
jgi:membrane glycosyltransferase